MGMDLLIDHAKRLVILKIHGNVTLDEIRACQRKLGSRPEIATYNAFADLSEIERLPQHSPDQVRELATVFVRSSGSAPTPLLAMAAPDGYLFAMAQMFENLCNVDERSRSRVKVFRGREEAAQFLRVPVEALAEHSELGALPESSQ